MNYEFQTGLNFSVKGIKKLSKDYVCLFRDLNERGVEYPSWFHWPRECGNLLNVCYANCHDIIKMVFALF